MKKVISLVMVILMLVTVLTACSGGGKDAEDPVVFGTIETTRWFSKINYYNSSCALVKSKMTIFPYIATTSTPTVSADGDVFAVSGIGEFFANDRLVMIDTKENKVKKVPTSVSAIFDVYAQGDSAFLISGVGMNLVRFDIQTEEEIEFKAENSDGVFVYAYEDTVYFVTENEDDSFLYLLDEKTLSVKKEYKVTEYFRYVNEMMVVGDKLYIAPSSVSDGVGTLVCLDMEKETFEEIKLETTQPCYDMTLYGEKLIIVNRDTHDPYEQYLTFIDVNTHEFETKVFSVPLEQIEAKGDRLYCLLDNVALASEETVVFVCDLTEADMPVMIRASLSTSDNYSIASFFML